VFGGWRPEAVVFDCDGLLVDTESCWMTAEVQLCAARGLALSGQDAAALIGASVPDVCRRLCHRLADGCSPEQVQDELVARVVAIVDREARAMAGAPELVGLVTARLPAAVASNSPRALLDQALQRGGLSNALTASVAADEVARPKPAPDLYRAACARLGVAPADALALEDSATGIRAATAAGLRTVGVPTPAGRQIGAEVTVSGLGDPGLVAWVRGWPLR
jgi:HAD superfamily hydrolase (TIGR01509 family)